MPADSITLIARPKVNLYLHVTGKREDGYHLLDSLVVFPDLGGDVITCTTSNQFSFVMSGPTAQLAGNDDNNLVVRAAHAYFNAIGKPADVAITLEKRLPVGGGIGGGSSDAATTIHALEEIIEPLHPQTRDALLLSLGADVPACYYAAPCRFEGIGGKIVNVPPPPPLHMVLVWPRVSSSTPEVFKKYKGPLSARADMPVNLTTTKSWIDFLNSTHNDLTDAALALHPVINDVCHIIASQKGCLLARMSGSGASVFGVFKTQDESVNAASTIATYYPDWWIKKGPIH